HGRYGRIGYGVAVLFVFLTAMHSSVLGALLTFAGSLWYPSYSGPAHVLHVDPLRDQQLAGLLMWVPAGVVFTLMGLGLFAGWLGNDLPNLIRWVQHPQQHEPGVAMPEMGVTGEDAREIAAYLYTLR